MTTTTIQLKALFLKEQQTQIKHIGQSYIYLQWSLNKFPDFFRMGTFIDSTHMKL